MKITLQWSHPNGLFGEITDLNEGDAKIMKQQMERDGCHVEWIEG